MCSLQMKEGRWVPGRVVQYYDVAGYLVGRWAGAFTLLITVISLFSTSASPALPPCPRSQADTSCRVAGARVSVFLMTIARPRESVNGLLATVAIPMCGKPWRSVSCS